MSREMSFLMGMYEGIRVAVLGAGGAGGGGGGFPVLVVEAGELLLWGYYFCFRLMIVHSKGIYLYI